MTYIGEHTFAGQLGHLLTLVSLTGALFACVGFLLHALTNDNGWRSVGRICFRAHSMAVVGIVVTLFIMLFNHWFEFDYVWKHSNTEMPLRYIASCFWEGQEGSFLLWTFWHMVLGNILIARARSFEGPVMTVFALVQVALATMLLGIYVGEVRIGSSPFLLIRELPENLGMPWTKLSDYLTRIQRFKEGRGLNPLLQNYWMVIHPPTLFLGFSTTLVPFSYAIAALWKRQWKDWLAPALPWTYFGIMILGTGILMGGAWAYEALSFGGFWAWDPVENASLVPWITLVGAGHLMLINKRKSTSLFTTLLLALGTFLLVLYSTFLTRSGVLGDTSVHSFTGEGMLPGLLIFMLCFVMISVAMLNTDRQLRLYYVLLSALIFVLGLTLRTYVPAIVLFGLVSLIMTVVAYRSGPFHLSEEENIWSREFWIFIGSLVLLLSALQITMTTSVPVVNLLSGPLQSAFSALGEATGWSWARDLSIAKFAAPAEPKAHYNKWQIPFAFIVALLVAVGQYLRYKDTDRRKFARELALSFFGAMVITALCIWWLGYVLAELTLIALLFATVFAALANGVYIFKVLKGALPKAGPSVAHVGFALVLMGALISTSKQRDISRNVKGPLLSTLSKDFDDGKDMLLYKGDTLPMGEHFVTFHDRRSEGVNLYYDMDYLRAEPRRFQRGDTVRVRNSIFVAKDDHLAGGSFLLDQPLHWEPLDSAAHRVFWHASAWSPTQPGAKVFELSPLLQLNDRFGEVAEPSTKHWLDNDLYTHIRYAKKDPNDSTDFMPPQLFDRMIGDTVVTPSCLIVLDSVRAVRDSVIMERLGPAFTAYACTFRVRDLYDPTRWFEARPVIVYRYDQPVGSKGFEIPELKVRIDVASVQGERIGVNVFEREFVILQAIIFPGINILWIGCVLMALGTGMAVWQRVKRKSAAA